MRPISNIFALFTNRLRAALALRRKKPGATKTFGRTVLPGILLFFSIVLTLVAWSISRRNQEEKTRYRFDYAVDNIQSAIGVRMTAYEQVLRSAVGFFYSSDTTAILFKI
ncbi:MAG: hypothetical protein EOO13_16390 [Chitinophagaceae bacterium]|nr:MAG: hypothetical protein EOO13_16390 [Chitinophagaceae bacterium]